MAKHKYKVCIIDLDLQFGDVCNFLQLTPQKTIYDAQLAMTEDFSGFAAAEYITPYEFEGINFSVLAAPVKLEESYNITAQAGSYSYFTAAQCLRLYCTGHYGRL